MNSITKSGPVKPKVSVCITTYNHAGYITKALESVLEQQTDFEFEVLVGEDDSSDGTREIVRKYAKGHPDVIRPFYNDRQNVIYINGQPTGRWNFLNNLRNARGEYIALLEGDDYWIDEFKLQKQVDFLDQRHEYSMCFTNAKIFNEEKLQFEPRTFCETHCAHGLGDTVVFSDLVGGHWIPTGTVVYRKSFLLDIPEWYKQLETGDWCLFLLLLQHGPGGFLDFCSSVYRAHAGGYWNSMSEAQKLNASINLCNKIADKFGKENQVAFLRTMVGLYKQQYKIQEKARKRLIWLVKCCQGIFLLHLQKLKNKKSNQDSAHISGST